MKLDHPLDDPFAIAQKIQSYFSEDRKQNQKPYASSSTSFSQGINPYLCQTAEGLALITDAAGTKLITPFGSWSILDKSIENFKKTFEVLREQFGLKLKNKSEFFTIWEITKSDKQKFDSLTFKKVENLISAEKVQAIFKDFVLNEPLTKSDMIATKVQSFFTDNANERDDKPWASYSGVYSEGPKAQLNQTKTGYALVTHGSLPVMLHTQCGRWNILGSAQADIRIKDIFKTLKDILGLEKICTKNGYTTWKITKFEEKKLEELSYKEENEYLCEERIKFAFDVFKTTNKGPWTKTELKSKL